MSYARVGNSFGKLVLEIKFLIILFLISVERLDYHLMRPVLIVGPLSDFVVDKLIQDYPRKFVKIQPIIMPYPQSYMDKNLEENNFIEYRRKGAQFECVTSATIQELCDKNVNGILDTWISLSAVERCHNRHIFPIVILLKFKSVKHVREVKDTRLPSDKIAAKAAKEMYEHVIKVEAEHRHLISGDYYLGKLYFLYTNCING